MEAPQFMDQHSDVYTNGFCDTTGIAAYLGPWLRQVQDTVKQGDSVYMHVYS